MAEKVITFEEAIALIGAKAKESEVQDCFRVKVMRKRAGLGGVGGVNEHVATLDGVRTMHCANPETWIPRLLGGGTYGLAVYTPTGTLPIAQLAPLIYSGEPRELDFNATKQQNWDGPVAIIWPAPPVTQPTVTVSVAPSASPHGTAPQTQASSASSPGVPPSVNPSTTALLAGGAGMADVLAAERSVTVRERELAEREARIREEAGRAQMEARLAQMKAESDARIAELKAAMVQPARPALDLGSIATGIASILLPLMDRQREREERAERLRREEMQASEQRRREEAQVSEQRFQAQLAAQQQQQQLLFQHLLQRPAIDPQIQAIMDRTEKLMEKVMDGRETPSAMAEQMMGMTGAVTEMASNFVRMVGEANGGNQPESPWVRVAEQVAGAITALGEQGKRPMRPPRERRRALPQGAPQGQPTQQPALQVVQGGAPQQPQQPAAAFAGAPVPAQPFTIVDELERMIRAHEDPAKIAAYLVQHYEDPDFQAALQEANMQLIDVFANRLGVEWAQQPANLSYVQNELLPTVLQAAEAAGLLGGPDDEESEDEEAAS